MYLGVALNFWYPLMTLFTASRKSFSVTVFLRARMANMPASVHTLLISAPERETHVRKPMYKVLTYHWHGKQITSNRAIEDYGKTSRKEAS